jgi:hypothetical protein
MSEFDEGISYIMRFFLGQVNSGQNNPAIKRELKRIYIKSHYWESDTKNQELTKLFELSFIDYLAYLNLSLYYAQNNCN